jgi:membrane dipeptidase
MDHVVYAIEKLGAKHVGWSSDFLKSEPRVYEEAYVDDEGYLNVEKPGTLKWNRYKWSALGQSQQYPWFVYPRGLKTYGELPNLSRELVARGFEDHEILQILGENYLTLYEDVVG